MTKIQNLTKGIIKENPVLILLLGLCPSLAVSTQAENALGMGAATTFVLLCSNTLVSLLRKVIPDKVHIPCYIVIIAGSVTLTQMAVEAYAYTLYQALGIFLPLITVNCIVLGRAEMFAQNNNVIDSVIDALGMGLGFTLTLLAIASVREIFGSGTWFGVKLPVLSSYNVPLLTLAPGGFVVLGCLLAVMKKATKEKTGKDFDCATCSLAKFCKKEGVCEDEL